MQNRLKNLLHKARKDRQKKPKEVQKPDFKPAYKQLGFRDPNDYFNWCVECGFFPDNNKSDLEIARERKELQICKYEQTLAENNFIKKVTPVKLYTLLEEGDDVDSKDNFINNFKEIYFIKKEELGKLIEVTPNCKKLFDDKHTIYQDYKSNHGNGTAFFALFNIFGLSNLWLRPLEDWKVPKSKKTMDVLNSLIQHLFFEYNMPNFLCSVFYKTKISSPNPDLETNNFGSFLELVVYIGKTGALRKGLGKTTRLPKFSKKQIHSLSMNKKNEIFERTISAVYLEDLIDNKKIITEYFKNPERRTAIPNDFLVDFLSYMDKQIMFDINQMWPLYDYVLHLRTQYNLEQKKFNFKGRLLVNLVQGMENWHRELGKTKHDYSWEKSPFTKDYIKEEMDKEKTYVVKSHTITELTSSNELRKEGRALSHCVASYAKSCKNGRCQIWSLRVEEFATSKPKSLVTIEIVSGRVVQARGKANRTPTSAEKNHIKIWANENNFIY